jgi:hypothetical protein
LIQQQQAVALEREATLQAGRCAREMELQAQQQVVELDQKRVRDQQELQRMQQECAVLLKDKDMLLQNLGTCQDLIREEAQVHQQEQAQYAVHIQRLQAIADSQVRDDQAGARDTMTRAALMSRDGVSSLHSGMGVAADLDNQGLLPTCPRPDHHQDGVRLLHESDLGTGQTKIKDPKEGMRHLWRSEFGLEQPVGFALI